MSAAVYGIGIEKKLALTKLRKFKNLAKSKYKISLLGIFGSVARGEQTEMSDLDILVKFEEGASLVSWSGLVNFLQNELKCKVDLADSENLRDSYKSFIFNDLIKI